MISTTGLDNGSLRIDWRGEPWSKDSGKVAAHPNSRFTVPAGQDPAIAPEWENPAGVPIDAILFGGRRASVVPLVTQSRDWAHGVFMGSIVASETTAAATGVVGNLRRDPFAMLPFCGYNMADYFGHWLSFADTYDESSLPKIFYVNWLRKGDDGRWLWPGFGENSLHLLAATRGNCGCLRLTLGLRRGATIGATFLARNSTMDHGVTANVAFVGVRPVPREGGVVRRCS